VNIDIMPTTFHLSPFKSTASYEAALRTAAAEVAAATHSSSTSSSRVNYIRDVDSITALGVITARVAELAADGLVAPATLVGKF
jgi:hypothetical protein